MRKLFTTALPLILWLGAASAPAETYAQTQAPALHLVQKIHIGELGSSDEAARFRLLLEDKLSQRGFNIADKPEKADAVLSGALSVSPAGVYGGRSDVGVTVRLVSISGERMWSINLPKPVTFGAVFKVRGLKVKEPVEYRAEELAKELREDWERSAKGVRTKPKK